MQYKILIVDDDKELVKMLHQYFQMKGYCVITAENGMKAMEMTANKPDIILLDINIPKIDGIEVCRRIRDKISCPIVFLTAKVEEQDRINGLLSGGDDYVLKPFSLKELDARIIAHLKREERHRTEVTHRFINGLFIDYSEKSVRIDNATLDFTKTEFEIIAFLSLNAGRVFDKERIYEKVCGYGGEGDSRGITELVRRIRKKFSVYTNTEYIETVWGVGYRWKK